VQIAYAIGIPHPVSIMVDSKRTGKVSDAKLTDLVRKHFDLTPQGLIKHLNLRRPIYRATATYGHFGRTEATFTWERTDKARMLARSV
jgi:S-adenosylmethionine synthetase